MGSYKIKQNRKAVVQNPLQNPLYSCLGASDGVLSFMGNVKKSIYLTHMVKLEENDHLSSVVILYHRSAHSAYAS